MIRTAVVFALLATVAFAGEGSFTATKVAGKSFDLNVSGLLDYPITLQNGGTGTYSLNSTQNPLNWTITDRQLEIHFSENVVENKPTPIGKVYELTLKLLSKSKNCYKVDAEANKTANLSISGKKFYKPQLYKATLCENK